MRVPIIGGTRSSKISITVCRVHKSFFLLSRTNCLTESSRSRPNFELVSQIDELSDGSLFREKSDCASPCAVSHLQTAFRRLVLPSPLPDENISRACERPVSYSEAAPKACEALQSYEQTNNYYRICRKGH